MGQSCWTPTSLLRFLIFVYLYKMPNHYVISQRLTVLLIVIIVSDYTIFSVPMVSCKNKSIIELSDITALLSFLLEKKKNIEILCIGVREHLWIDG